MFLFSKVPVLSDIHCHIIPYVDDGASDIEDALELVKEEYSQGVRYMVMTPHLRENMFDTSISDVKDHFKKLNELIKKAGISDLNIYLSREYYCDDRLKALLEGYCAGRERVVFEDKQYFPDKEIIPFGKYKCILLEFSSSQYQADEFSSFTELAIAAGLVPVIAHAERYKYIQENPRCAEKLRKEGTYIQANADAIIGRDLKIRVDTARKLVTAGYVDIVASDVHDPEIRKPSLAKCYGYLKKKVGKEYADCLMNETACKLLKG